jgi:excisionase family DNA binding protein
VSYTVKEAARILGVSKTRVYKLIERGRIRLTGSSPRLSGDRGGVASRVMLLDAGDVEREKEARA